VHGLLGYSFGWRRVIPILARNRALFAPDMPGAGFSECRRDLDCRLAASARRLGSFLDAAQITVCDLVGSSYGGATALMLASEEPGRIRRLVLVSPVNPWSKIGRKRLLILGNPVIARLFPTLARAASPIHPYFVRRMWADPRRISAETLRGYLRPLIRPGVLEHAVKIVCRWKADMRELASALTKIRETPTLLVWGSQDRAVDIRSAPLLADCFRHATVQTIEGAGHIPYEETPEEFCRIVEEFLGGVLPMVPADSSREVT
jgi:pimeloyl-ACP methyl ester carboxylesterase